MYNRTTEKVSQFVDGEAKGTNIVASCSLADFVSKLGAPRKILLMVKAGKPVDDFIDSLLPLLSPGDCIVDGGNSLYTDTLRRCQHLESIGLLFVGCGVSGGEEGARYGPSMMPGGSPNAWPLIQPIFQAVSAVAHERPCCQWIGPSGSGHFIKMVHNGIEYGDMQLISEIYCICCRGLMMGADEMAQMFSLWNSKQSPLESFLIEITADILSFKDPLDNQYLLPKIRDAAGQAFPSIYIHIYMHTYTMQTFCIWIYIMPAQYLSNCLKILYCVDLIEGNR